MCYVGQRGGQGANTGLRCEGAILGPQRPPVDHVGGDDDLDDVCCCAVFRSILPLFYSCPLICFCFCGSLCFVSHFLSLFFCSTDTPVSMGESNGSGRIC